MTTTPFRVYVASPYQEARFIRSTVHPMLREHGLEPVSRWAEQATGAEVLDHLSAAVAIVMNDADVERADAVLVLPTRTGGAEMYCEMRYALTLGKPVVYVTSERVMLSAYRHGVIRVDWPRDALAELQRMRDGWARPTTETAP
jgi:nucleoside 2-deoxyribosyltransferase